MNSISKQATRDAFEYARAQMAVGEGAGNRRKLIMTQVAHRANNNPSYKHTFQRALGQQDMAKHAEAARKEAKRLGLTKAFDKNFRALASGNKQHMSSQVLLAFTIGYGAHKLGWDKIAVDAAKKFYNDVRLKLKQEQRKAAVYNITNVTTDVPHQREGS